MQIESNAHDEEYIKRQQSEEVDGNQNVVQPVQSLRKLVTENKMFSGSS
jgi:hypothetical protein